MIRGLPENYLFPGNNKVWHGIVAWHFCLILIVLMWGLLPKGRQVKIMTKITMTVSDTMPMILLHITRVHKGEGIHRYEKKGFLFMMDGIPAPGLARSFPGPVLPAFLSVSDLSGSTGPS